MEQADGEIDGDDDAEVHGVDATDLSSAQQRLAVDRDSGRGSGRPRAQHVDGEQQHPPWRLKALAARGEVAGTLLRQPQAKRRRGER